MKTLREKPVLIGPTLGGAPKNNRGVALLLVLVSMFLLTILVYQILFTGSVDLAITGSMKRRVQAYYLAQSATKFAILRLHLYKEVKNLAEQSGGALPIPKELIDKIWAQALPQFPFTGSKTDWPGTIMSQISSEGSKIPINLIDGNTNRGSSDEIKKSITEQVKGLIVAMASEEENEKQYKGMLPEDILNPLIDWIDADQVKVEGGDEQSDYDRKDPVYYPRNDRIPTLTEIHMINNWTDDLYDKIAKQFSVLNNDPTINPNFISLQRLKAIEPTLTQEDLMAIERHRQEKPFGSIEDLENFIHTDPNVKNGRNFKFPDIKMKARETVFIVEGTGLIGDSKRTLRLGIRMGEEEPPKGTTPNTGSSDSPNPKKQAKLKEPIVLSVEEAI